MTDTKTPNQTPPLDDSSAVHKPFSWLRDEVKDHPMANFVALTMDVCRGIETCLQIVHASDLERSSNAEVDPEDAELPVLNVFDTTNLLRLSIASAALLHEVAAKKLGSINAHALGQFKSVKDRTK